MAGDPNKTMSVARAATLWKPGQSGNPNGLNSRAAKLLQKCQVYSLNGAKILNDVLHSPEAKDQDKLKAWELLTNRGFGKPRETVDVNSNVTVGVTWTSIVAEAHKALEASKQVAMSENVIEAEFEQ